MMGSKVLLRNRKMYLAKPDEPGVKALLQDDGASDVTQTLIVPALSTFLLAWIAATTAVAQAA
jgi:hypothetical protein